MTDAGDIGRSIEELRAALERIDRRTCELRRELAEVHAPPRLAGVRALVVVAEAGVLGALRDALERQGAEVRTADSALAAVRHFDEERPDILVAGLDLPDVGGCSLMRVVRAREAARGGQVPAIAVSALAVGNERALALEAGFQDLLSAPVSADALVPVVSQLLGR